MRFWVKVPVLSEQITDTQPKPSTACSFFIMACCFAILLVPMAKAMVTMEDKASGIAATANATAKSRESSQFIRWNRLMTNTARQTIIMPMDSFLEGAVYGLPRDSF